MRGAPPETRVSLSSWKAWPTSPSPALMEMVSRSSRRNPRPARGTSLDERAVKVRRGRIRGDLLVAHGQSDQILLRPRTHPPGKLRRPLAPRYLAAREWM